MDNLVVNLVCAIGLFIFGGLALTIAVLFLLGLGQLFLNLGAYVLPRMGLRIIRDARNGDLPFTQLMEEMIHPPKVSVMLEAPKETVEGEYEDSRTRSRDLRVR